MTTNTLEVSELDFQNIKKNLRTFLSSQDILSDYDFNGSALSVIVDLLAYNTHYNALYTNFAFNEMFLDSASKRSSLVSIANNYGYLPSSAKSARAMINLRITNISADTALLVLPRLSMFTTKIGNNQYIFYTMEDYLAQKFYDNAGHAYFEFKDVYIYEGVLQEIKFVCTEEYEKFSIPFRDIDTSTMSVFVYDNSTAIQKTQYALAKNVVDLDTTSTVFYLKETPNQSYELTFGQANLGIPIAIANCITVNCLSSSKELGNNATNFTFTNTIGGTSYVTLVENSFGGGEAESMEEIRYNTSKFFFDQDRAITASDFKAIIKRYYENVDSISVWGGEDNIPPVYGKVFVSIKPKNKLFLTTSEETYIKNMILKPRSIATVTTEFVRPSYIELDVNTTVYYNKNDTYSSANEIKYAVTQAINNYSDTELKKFDGVFRMSKFSSIIDNVNTAIQSNITKIKLLLSAIPNYGIMSEYKFDIGNPIFTFGEADESMISNGFYIDSSSDIYYLDDDGKGSIRLFKRIQNSTKNFVSRALPNSSIDYANGIIKISGLFITRLVDSELVLKVKPQSFDVLPNKNQIVLVKNITVNILENTKTNYVFTSSQN